jgi:putative transposase
MARLARSTVAGYPHHVAQRGNYGQAVFDGPADYARYIDWFKAYMDRYGVDIWAYCLMPNHVHFICVPRAEGALAKTFNTTHMRYAQYFNGKRDVSGHLWRARFMSCVLDRPSVFEEVRFVETNPIRAGLVVAAEDYPWSSARSHVTGRPDPLLAEGFYLQDEVGDWRAYLAGRGDEAIVAKARERLRTGRPAGNLEFIRTLEAILGRKLEALPRGRPRKAAFHVTAKQI